MSLSGRGAGPTADLTIGVDIGGTKVAAGVVDADGRILATSRRETPSSDPQKTEDLIVDVVRELGATHRVEAVGIGAAGFVDADRSTVRFAPNLAWRNEPLGQALEARLRVPVVVENDANAAAWAEARFGAGNDEPHVVVVTVGTGIGGGVIIDHRLLRGRSLTQPSKPFRKAPDLRPFGARLGIEQPVGAAAVEHLRQRTDQTSLGQLLAPEQGRQQRHSAPAHCGGRVEHLRAHVDGPGIALGPFQPEVPPPLRPPPA